MGEASENLLKAFEARHPGLGGPDEDAEEAEEDPNSRRILSAVPQSTFAGAFRCCIQQRPSCPHFMLSTGTFLFLFV